MASNIQAIVMPKLGLSMTEGMVAKWHVQAGASVAPGDVIADIETSKITNELEARGAGVIRGSLAEEGVDLPVGSLLCVLADEAATEQEVEAFAAAFSPLDGDSMEVAGEPAGDTHGANEIAEAKAGESRKGDAGSGAVPASLQGAEDDAQAPATHLARKLARRLGVNLNKIAGSGRRGRISKRDIEQAILAAGGAMPAARSTQPARPMAADDRHIPATPLARKVAAQAGLNLAEATPTGTRGRVTRADVEKAIAASNLAASAQPAAQPAAASASGEACEEVPLTSMQRTIARRLAESKQAAPHFRLTVEANMDRMLSLRADLAHSMENGKVSINDLLVKAVASALMKAPAVNIQFDGETIRRYAAAHVAVAVALENGLLTPVIQNANQKSVMEISREMKELTERARSGALKPDEFEGGTFTLSNLGMFGIKAFDAIINPPQAAILAVGATERRRILADDGERTATMMTATLSCDHRVIDGAAGARFLQAFKEVAEHPYRLLI